MEIAKETKRQTEILIGKLITRINRVTDLELKAEIQKDIDLFINGNRKFKTEIMKEGSLK